MEHSEENGEMNWWVLRDLKRPNARKPAYRQLEEACFEVFVPMKKVLVMRQGRRCREQVPVIRDLLFVHSTRELLDEEVENTPTLQYRYITGAAYRTPMTVRKAEMQRFIRAVESSCSDPIYYTMEEISPDKYGREVQIVGGNLDGYTGRLLRVQGSRARRLIVELPGFFAAGVEVRPEYVQFV